MQVPTKFSSFEKLYLFTVVQNFRTKTGLGGCGFNWFCAAVYMVNSILC